MSVSDKLKSLLTLKGKKSIDLANHFDISPQSMRNKFARGSFSVADLIKISEFTGCPLYFEVGDGQRIALEPADLPPEKDEPEKGPGA